MRVTRAVFAGLLVWAVVLTGGRAGACSVPVFRYALERWPAAPYELHVFHRGPLGEDEKKIVDWLETCSGGPGVVSNVEPLLVDLDGKPDAETLELWKKETGATLPWMVLSYPRFYQFPGKVWSGPLTAANAKGLLDSPARREIGQRILGGQAAVWVLLETGAAGKDTPARELLEAEIIKMKTTLQVSEILPEDLMEGMEEDAPEIKVDFSLLSLSRADPAERVLIEILLGSEADLRSADEPIVYPVFGQGRALCALMGKGISAENLRDIGQFLVGPCSCMVRDQNPGVDLLMSVDWTALPEGPYVKPPELPPLTGIPDVSPKTATPQRDSGGPVTWRWMSRGEHGALGRGILAVGVLVILVAVFATVFLRRGRHREEA